MQQQLSATPDEVVAIMQEMYPAQLDRAVAELHIRKLQARVAELESQVADHIDAVVHHDHTHNDD
jgi:S-adenosylhomocysteine hydrolase